MSISIELEQEYLTVAQTAKRKGVSRQAIYGALKAEHLPYRTIFGKIGIRPEDADAYQPLLIGERKGRSLKRRQVRVPFQQEVQDQEVQDKAKIAGGNNEF